MLWERRDPGQALRAGFGFSDARAAGRWVADTLDRLPAQLVHFDFRSANVLSAGAEVTAILDFEEAQHDHRLVELARAAILLGTRYHDWGPVPAEVRAGFLAGYQAVCPLTPDEASWLEILLLWQAMAMVPPGDDPTGWGPSALSQLPRP
ncbi:phosphotransferase enzyme family protein [Actinoplanes siamensis]|nr:phosphotransferase [Actinoplanes siamensis]